LFSEGSEYRKKIQKWKFSLSQESTKISISTDIGRIYVFLPNPGEVPHRGESGANLDLDEQDVGDDGDVGDFGVVDKPSAAHNVDVEEYEHSSS